MAKTDRKVKQSLTKRTSSKDELTDEKKPTSLPSTKSRRSWKSQSSKQTNKSVSLPPIANPPKAVPSALFQTVYRFQGQAPIVIEDNRPPPTPLRPINAHKNVPLMKERTVRENLGKKSTIKCKSPQSDAALSRSTFSMATDQQTQSRIHHPLQQMDVSSLLSESAKNRLKRIFRRLDTDQDGHLTYSQVEKCLPANLPLAQISYFRVTYDVLTDGTFFGLQEFYAIAIIIELIAKQDPVLWNLRLDKVDFNFYHDAIVEFLDDFNQLAPSALSRLDYSQLLRLINQRIPQHSLEHFATELKYLMPKITTMKMNRLDFLTIIPALIYLESTCFPKRGLFRFRENSILDLHLTRKLVA